MKINIKKSALGDFIEITREDFEIGERDSLPIRIIEGNEFVLGELSITTNLKIFYRHTKRGYVKDLFSEPKE